MTASDALHAVLEHVDGWGTDNASTAVVGPSGPLATHGDLRLSYRWASVTKLVTALTVLIAAERDMLGLDEPAGPPGATVRHLLAHTSGLPFEGGLVVARPGSRRIYSNRGFDVLGVLVAERTGRPFGATMAEWVLEPLRMAGSELIERPSDGLHGPLADLASLARELLRPTMLPVPTMAAATGVAFPGLAGIVPGVGPFDPCDWGLGFELHDGKIPHWMGRQNSVETFGHFGGTGTFLWVDPVADLALAVLTDRAFGPWSLRAWPALSDEVLALSGRQAASAAGRTVEGG